MKDRGFLVQACGLSAGPLPPPSPKGSAKRIPMRIRKEVPEPGLNIKLLKLLFLSRRGMMPFNPFAITGCLLHRHRACYDSGPGIQAQCYSCRWSGGWA